jgi:four helix bundle protein
MEVVSQLRIAERRDFVSSEDTTKIYQQCEQISRMLSGLRASLERKAT